MNRKISLGVTISLVAVACAITFVLTMTVSLNMYNGMVAGVQEREEIYTKIKEIDSYVRANTIEDIDENVLINNIMAGYINGIDDKYAQYYPADDYYQIQQSDSGTVVGVGIKVITSGNYLQVSEVYDDSSAKTAGIKKGDIITEIDEKSVPEMGVAAAKKAINGDEGTKVILKIQTTDGQEETHTLIRHTLEIKSVIGRLIDGYAYIRITAFNEKTAEQFTQMIDKYESESVLGYIFDVRQNSGGLASALSEMLNRVLPEAIVAKARYADGTEKNLIETDSTASLKTPMVVMVDGGSASASELFAVSLRDFGKASLVGSTTYGKAVMQTTQSFKDGSAVSISTALIIPTASEEYNDVGVKPDYSLDITAEQLSAIDYENEKSDPQLIKALEIIATK